jgi:hypothetical protein
MSISWKMLILLLVSPLGTWARECQDSGPAHIGASENSQLFVCSGADGTVKLVGNMNVEGRVTATQPSEREKALERKLTAALQRIEQHEDVISDMNGTIWDMNGTISELEDALQHAAAVNAVTSGMNVTLDGHLVTCDPWAYRDVTHVTGNLMIRDCAYLTSLLGLSRLTAVGGNLTISNNDALTNVNGLASLTTVGGYLNIVGNAALTDVNGLSNLTTVRGDYIRICYNTRLTTIPPLFTNLSVGKTSFNQCLKTGDFCNC